MIQQTALEEKIGKALIERRFLSSEEWEKCLKLAELCRHHKVYIPLHQIISQCYATTTEKQLRLFRILLKTIEPLIVVSEVDPMALSGGAEWFLLLKALEDKKIEHVKLQECQRIEEAFHHRGLFLNLAEILRLKGYAPRDIVKKSSSMANPSPHRTQTELSRRVDLISFCRKVRRGKVLPLSHTITDLSEEILPQPVVKEVIEDTQWAMDTCRVVVTPGFLLYRKYFWDPTLIHALFLSQIKVDKGHMNIYVGNLLLKAPPLPSRAQEEVRDGASFMRDFLEWTYRMNWLSFNPEEENTLVKFIESNIRGRKISQVQHIFDELANNGLILNLPKLFYLKKEVEENLFRDGIERVTPEIMREEISRSSTDNSMLEQEELSPEMDLRIGKLALSQGMLTEEELQNALMIHVTARTHGENKKLGEVMIERSYLSSQQLDEILKLREELIGQKPSSQMGPTDEDVKLISVIQKYNFLPHEDIQRCLSLQLKLQQVGIFQSMGQLLSQYRFLSHQMVLDLLGEIHRRAEEKARPLKEALDKIDIREQGKSDLKEQAVEQVPLSTTPIITAKLKTKSHTIRIASFFASIMLLLISLLFAWFKMTYLKTKDTPVSTNETLITSQPNPLTPQTHSTSNFPSADEHLRRAMKSRGLVEYRGLWITPEKRAKLMELDTRDTHFKEEIRVESISILYKDSNLNFEGKLSTVTLLEEHEIYLDTYILACFNLDDVYAAKQVIADYKGRFKATMGPLPKPLLAGYYRLKIILDPRSQHPHVNRILNISVPQTWIFHFKVGEINEIKGIIEEDDKSIQSAFEEYNGLFQSLEEQSLRPSRISHENWNQWAPAWQEKRKKLKEFLQRRIDTALIPRFPQTECRLIVLGRDIDRYYYNLESWHRGGSLIPPKELILRNEFLGLLTATRASFREESEKLQEILSQYDKYGKEEKNKSSDDGSNSKNPDDSQKTKKTENTSKQAHEEK